MTRRLSLGVLGTLGCVADHEPIHGWVASCAGCTAGLQVITDGREAFALRLSDASRATGAHIVGLRNEELGVWAVLADDDDVAVCPVCGHPNRLLRPPSASDLN